jgi:squalene cyclase
MAEKREDETTTGFWIRQIQEKARADAIEECVVAIQNHYGFSEDEKRIATAVLNAIQPSIVAVGSP